MTTPDYGKYTRRELAEAARSIDAERFPGRAEKIRREIGKRDAEAAEVAAAHPTRTDTRPAPRPQRLAALFIDLATFQAAWSLVEGAVVFPVPAVVLEFLRFAALCLFFSVRDEHRGTSFGKSLLHLRVLADGDAPLPRRRLLLRAAIVGVPLFFPFDELVAAVAPATPELVMGVVSGLLLGVLAYDALLVLTPSRRALHDRLAGTRVFRVEEVPDRQGEPTAPPPPVSPGPALMERRFAGVAVIVAGGLLPIVALQATHVGRPLSEWVREPVREAGEPAHHFEEVFARDAHLRTDVTIREVTQYRSDRPTKRLLVIGVRIPYLGWTAKNRQAVLDGITRELRVDPGAYDGLSVEMKSEVLFFHWNRQVALTVNPT